MTSFFRDFEAWEHLHTEILPQVLEANNGGRSGCGVRDVQLGQEAYTIAMLLHGEMGSGFRERVKIYATDVDEDASTMPDRRATPNARCGDCPTSIGSDTSTWSMAVTWSPRISDAA